MQFAAFKEETLYTEASIFIEILASEYDEYLNTSRIQQLRNQTCILN